MTRSLPATRQHSHCLFCLKKCSSSMNLKIPGAGSCNMLNKQLEQFFIMHKLLDIPRKWCEDILLQKQIQMNTKWIKKESTEDVADGNQLIEEEEETDPALSMEQWFIVCRKCSEEIVDPGWNAFQKLLEAETAVKRIKIELKDKMKRQILQKRRCRRWYGFVGVGTDVEIRKLIFPDMSASVGKRNENKLRIQVEQNTESTTHYEDIEWKPPLDLDDYGDSDTDLHITAPSPRDSLQIAASKNIKRLKGVSSALKLIRRSKKQNRKRPKNKQRFKCSECDSYYTNPEDLSKHQEIHELRKQHGPGLHDCDKCSYPATDLIDLQKHKQVRHRIQEYPCPKCLFKANSWKKLKVHVTSEHPDMTNKELEDNDMSLKCSVCSRQFLRMENFVIHQRKMHPELFGEAMAKPVQCMQCGRKFPSKIRLDHHIISHHTEKPMNFVCTECGKGFKWQCRLDDHMQVYHCHSKKNFVCDVCGMDYSTASVLAKHYRKMHSGQTETGGEKLKQEDSSKDFKCRFCELTSPFRVVINRHMKTHIEQTGHRCEKCGKAYMTGQSLQRHIRISHPLVKETFPCPHCLRPFTSKEYMKDHVTKFCRMKNIEQQTPIVIVDPVHVSVKQSDIDTKTTISIEEPQILQMQFSSFLPNNS